MITKQGMHVLDPLDIVTSKVDLVHSLGSIPMLLVGVPSPACAAEMGTSSHVDKPASVD